ncbi:MAG TPA: acetyl-CoA carboxylase biotin carboxylase subunit [Candidatus Saccharimonadaceae bacterium]|nr:acetyl-CoA carboxylase biotin carboxylase subunit [Candidatus Saccharimonadaceae bacterium]
MKPIRRVLIANRGEIAVRIARTLRERDVTSIAVFSEPDRASLHVLLADEAYPIGPGPSRDSYLNLERVLETAKRVRADAVHPGYGFFAENPVFAKACAEAGLAFIGPKPETIAALGDKLAARAAAERAGVPIIPGSPGPVATLGEARDVAKRIGFPLMLKAAAGGGGKGMRVVRSDAELSAAWDVTRGEAGAAFGDDRVFVERAIERPRHVEAQILADSSGRVAFLGERECSVQRRHQKLLEETPSPAFDAKTRAAFGDAACRIAKAVGYLSAGTVEFILDEEGRFYFLEVNTRLQVEHPVTEMVTGLDLVAEQLAIAEGAPLSFGDTPPVPRGASMEARIIAEDPAANFMPSVGRVERVRFPQGPGVRNDAGIYRGYQVPVFYDSLLSKLVVWGEDREHARRRMLRALGEFVLEGLHHNVAFHRWLVAHEAFAAGNLSTRFLDEHFKPEMLAPDATAGEIALLAAALHAREQSLEVSLPGGNGVERSPWRWSDRRRAGGRTRA